MIHLGRVATAAILALLVLTACSDKHPNTTFDQRCLPNGFTAQQCKFLKQIARRARDAGDFASTALVVGVGASVSAAGAKR